MIIKVYLIQRNIYARGIEKKEDFRKYNPRCQFRFCLGPMTTGDAKIYKIQFLPPRS